MSISNAQYDEIMRTYEEKQNNNRHLVEARRGEVYTKIPEYKALDSSVADISLEQGKKLINGETGALALLRDRIREINTRKKELLIANGYPEDYLDPVYSCPECRDTGYVGTQKCKCLKQAIICCCQGV